MSVTNKPRIEAYIGGSGSGKGVSINRRLAELKPPRLLIWDPRNEYGKHATAVRKLAPLVQAVKKAGAGSFKLRFVAGPELDLAEAFGMVCRLAFATGNCLFLAEELSDVTTAGRAPPAWRQVITQGRHQGLHVLGAAQRPALIDKTFLGNSTFIRCFTLRYAEDRKAMAAALDVRREQVDALQTIEDERKTTINFLERHFRNAEPAQAGQIVLRR